MTTAVAPGRRAHAGVRATSGHEAARRASRLVGGAALDTAAVPAAAVLLVRRLMDPMPRRIATNAHAPAASPGWERALRASIAECYRTAARPAHAPVAGNVNAVCFEDRAELLACLVRDALTGAVPERWWWRAFLRTIGRSPSDALGALWHQDAQLVPAVLDQLARTGHALPLVSALSPAVAVRALYDVVMAFELPALAASTAAVASETAWNGLPHAAPAARTGDIAVASASAAETSAEKPPWLPVARDVPLPPAMSPECSALLGVSLVLARAPLVARRGDFARTLHAWRLAVEHQRAAVAAPDVAPSVRPAPPLRQAGVQLTPSVERVAIAAGEVPRAPAAPQVANPLPTGAAESEKPTEAGERAPGLMAAPRVSDPSNDSSGRSNDVAAQAQAVLTGNALAAADTRIDAEDVASAVTDGEMIVTPPPKPHVVTREPPPSIGEPSLSRSTDPLREKLAAGVVTELGGALFLVNALQHLRFFDLLDEHFGIAAPFGGWGWLELFARTLLGRDSTWASADPLWRALAALDGRENGEPLVAELHEAPEEYRLPSSWFGEAVAERTPLRVTAARRRAARRSACSPLDLRPGVRLRRFTEFVMPYLRWRLAGALGLRELDDASAERLLRRRAWLYVTRSHVDLRIPLDTADVATRRAGLDANPGWVPQLGRVITFHFDASDL